MLSIKNNVMAANAARQLSRGYNDLSASVERLASGLRINSAKDDAAGLAVRELIRADIAVLDQGARNALDGISMLQTMEGAMAVVDDNLIRMKELAEQAATGSYSVAQRAIMNTEFQEMADEIERIATSTRFNDITMLDSASGTISIHVGTNTTIDVNKVDVTKAGLGIGGTAEYVASATGITNADATWFTTAGTAEVFAIQFGTENTITVDSFANSTAYTMNEVADLINAASRAVSDYNAAEVVYDEQTSQYRLKISAENAGNVAVSYTGNTFNGTGKGLDDATEFMGVDGTGTAVDILTTTNAAAALATIQSAINLKDEARAAFGYKMHHLEQSIAVLEVQAENLMAAESRISDVDVATEMATLTRTQVLSQAGTNMLGQASQMPQMVLTLLR